MKITRHFDELGIEGFPEPILPDGWRKQETKPKLRVKEVFVSAACRKGKHLACYKLNCSCDCGHLT